MIDFSKAKEELNWYKGSEKKKTLVYDNTRYLVKFPDPIREKNKNISYINNAFSEYIGSNIFNICVVLGIPVALFGSVVPSSFQIIDLVFLIGSTIILYIFSKTSKKITRIEGIIMLVLFIIYYIVVFI